MRYNTSLDFAAQQSNRATRVQQSNKKREANGFVGIEGKTGHQHTVNCPDLGENCNHCGLPNLFAKVCRKIQIDHKIKQQSKRIIKF